MLLLLTAFLVALLIRFTFDSSSAKETTLKPDSQTLSYAHTPSSIEEKYTFTKPLHISNRINHIHRLMVNLTHATAGKSFNPRHLLNAMRRSARITDHTLFTALETAIDSQSISTLRDFFQVTLEHLIHNADHRQHRLLAAQLLFDKTTIRSAKDLNTFIHNWTRDAYIFSLKDSFTFLNHSIEYGAFNRFNNKTYLRQLASDSSTVNEFLYHLHISNRWSTFFTSHLAPLSQCHYNSSRKFITPSTRTNHHSNPGSRYNRITYHPPVEAAAELHHNKPSLPYIELLQDTALVHPHSSASQNTKATSALLHTSKNTPRRVITPHSSSRQNSYYYNTSSFPFTVKGGRDSLQLLQKHHTLDLPLY